MWMWLSLEAQKRVWWWRHICYNYAGPTPTSNSDNFRLSPCALICVLSVLSPAAFTILFVFLPTTNEWAAFTIAKVKDSQRDYHHWPQLVRIFPIHMYWSLNTIFHLAESKVTNLKFATFIVLFKRGSFIIAGKVWYLSTTSIAPENMRLIHMPLLIEKLVYNSLCLQAANHCPETSVAEIRKKFVRPHQRQSDPTIRKVLGKDNSWVLSTPINPRNSLRSSCWSCPVVFQ